jgi:hypothetical protein
MGAKHLEKMSAQSLRLMNPVGCFRLVSDGLFGNLAASPQLPNMQFDRYCPLIFQLSSTN